MSLVASPDIMYRLLIQSVVDYAIYLLTPEGIVANRNPGAQRAKGYHAEEIVGQHYSLFYTDAERSAGLPGLNLEQARNTGRFEEVGSRLRKDGSAFQAHVVFDAVYDGAPCGGSAHGRPVLRWRLRQRTARSRPGPRGIAIAPDDNDQAEQLSAVQFKNGNLVHIVALALADSGLPARRLELEITESVLLGNSEENVRTLRALKDLGVSISLDDFGTGYSSLGYLRSFPFDRIKIDKSFVHDMCDSREAMSIIRAITDLSNSLMIKTTAEGVESEEQMRRLAAEGCSHFQGYLYGRPAPASERLKQVVTLE